LIRQRLFRCGFYCRKRA